MSVTTATRTAVTVPDFTEKEMRRYFDTPPAWPIIVAVLGGLFVLLGLATLNNNGAGCAFVGLLVLAVGALGYYFTWMGTKPTDQEYDAWVARKTGVLEPDARKALSLIDNSQIVGQVLRVDGVVPPTIGTLQAYGEVRTKQGKDGYTRFSINTVKYFYPEEHKLGAYRDIVNALHQGLHRAKTEEFFYSDIVGVTTEDTSLAVVTGEKSSRPITVNVSAKTFRLIASSGDTTGTDGDVVEVSSATGAKLFRSRGTAIDQTVTSLRKLLNDKKGAAAQSQQNFQEQQAKMQADMQQRMLEMQQQMLEQMQRMGQSGSVPPAPPTGEETGA